MLKVKQLASIVLRPEGSVFLGSKNGHGHGEHQASDRAAERHATRGYRHGSAPSNERQTRSSQKISPRDLTRPISGVNCPVEVAILQTRAGAVSAELPPQVFATIK